ncbi:MAG: hypothetical protein CME65_00940 [Halobacteriovoraceae bacterium]|nr:hypothetical protein [Halobacteriovoraceae bacterium]
MNSVLGILQILGLIFLVACNPTEQKDVDLGAASLSAATFNYNASVVEGIENTTDIGVYPSELFDAAYTITPDLPSGLSIDSSTGEISGVATETQTATTHRIVATTSTGSTEVAFVTITILAEAPATLTYGVSILAFEKGISTTSYSPTVSGGTPTSYSVDSDLPAGLNIDPSTGVISGTATAVESKVIQVEASNSTGSTFLNIVVSVRKAAPVFNATPYSNDAQTIDVGTAITSMVASLDTPLADATFEIRPSLPTGLNFDTSTGIISGTPTAYTGITNFEVRVYNEIGDDTADITITFEQPAVSLDYPADNDAVINAYVVQEGVKIKDIIPTYVGGEPGPTGFVMEATDLAAIQAIGLSFDQSDGRISGTPTGTLNRVLDIDVTSTTDATATVTISDTFTLDVAEDYPEDANDLGYEDSYTLSQFVSPSNHCIDISAGTQDTDITDETICRNTTLRAWNEENSLCYEIDATTPITTAFSTQATCDANGTNAAWINTNDATPLRPSGDGLKPRDSARATKYEISAALPSGLELNDQTGEITGTPLVQLSPTAFTITGYTLYGDGTTDKSHTHTFTLEVSVSAPQSLGYSNIDSTVCAYKNDTLNVFELQDGVEALGVSGGNCIFPTVPKGSGIPTSYSITPKLPNGLSLNTTTGVISGTPNEILPVKYYTIVGTNSAGSVSESIAISTNTIIAPQSLDYSGDGYASADPDTNNEDTLSFNLFSSTIFDPTYVGGQGTFTITSGELPSGLTLDSKTGRISGIPLVAANPFPSVTINVSNSEGLLPEPVIIEFDISNLSLDADTSGTIEATEFYAVGADDLDDNGVDDNDIVLLTVGDTMNNSVAVIGSGYDTQTAGYINSYTATTTDGWNINTLLNVGIDESGNFYDLNGYCVDISGETTDGTITDETTCRETFYRAWNEENSLCYIVDENTPLASSLTTQTNCDAGGSDAAWIAFDGVTPSEYRAYDPTAGGASPFTCCTVEFALTAENIGGGGVTNESFTTAQVDDTIDILVVEEEPDYDYSKYGNVVVIQGGLAADGTNAYTPDANGGLVASYDSDNGGATTTAYCTATDLGSSTALTAQIAADFNGGTSTGYLGSPNTTFNSNFACEFEQPGAGNCFGDLVMDYSVQIEARNSGTLYRSGARNTASSGQLETIRVIVGDGPNFEFEPSPDRFADETHLTIDSTSLNAAILNNASSYTPNTTNLCHQGDYNLTTAGDLPSPFTFSGSTGAIAKTDNAILGRRTFSLSSSRSLAGNTISKEESITVQANHILTPLTGTASAHRFKIMQFDIDADGNNDFILFDTYCEGNTDGIACAGTIPGAAYLNNTGAVALYDGTEVAFSVGANLDARAAAPFYYETGNSALAYLADDGTVTVDSFATIDDLTATTNANQYGIVPAADTTTKILFTVGVNGNQFSTYKIELDATTPLDEVGTPATVTGPFTVSDGSSGGADVGTINFVRSFDMDDDGDNEALVAYVDSNDGLHKVCIIGNTAGNLNTACDTLISAPTGESIREIKFSDVVGDDLDDLIIQTYGSDNTLYFYENRNDSLAGFFQLVDTLTTKSTVDMAGFGLGDVNNDGNPDLVIADVVTDPNGDGDMNTGYTIYYNTSSSDLFTASVSDVGASDGQDFFYHYSEGSTNEIELLDTGSSTLLMHCQTDTVDDDSVASTDDDPHASCGIIGEFAN